MKPVIDADRHTVEPMEMWPQYLPARYRDGGPTYGFDDRETFEAAKRARFGGLDVELEPTPIVMLDGQPLLRGFGAAAQVEQAIQVKSRRTAWFSAADPAGQCASMDRSGIDVAYLFPTWTSYLLAVDGMAPDRAAAFAEAYNRWLRDYCSHDPVRLKPVAVVPRHDPEAMVAELERVIAWGVRAVVLRPNRVVGRGLSDPAYARFFEICAAEGVAVALHEGSHARVETAGATRFETRFGQHACSHPLEQMQALVELLEGGVLERHPELRVAFMEAGAGWVPYWLGRLDEEYHQLRGEVRGRVEQPPSAYFKRQCWVALEPHEPQLESVIEALGVDRLLFGSDYPHFDHDADLLQQLQRRAEETPSPDLDALLRRNPAAFFGSDSDSQLNNNRRT